VLLKSVTKSFWFVLDKLYFCNLDIVVVLFFSVPQLTSFVNCMPLLSSLKNCRMICILSLFESILYDLCLSVALHAKSEIHG
jgi:hypothetical protein